MKFPWTKQGESPVPVPPATKERITRTTRYVKVTCTGEQFLKALLGEDYAADGLYTIGVKRDSSEYAFPSHVFVGPQYHVTIESPQLVEQTS